MNFEVLHDWLEAMTRHIVSLHYVDDDPLPRPAPPAGWDQVFDADAVVRLVTAWHNGKKGLGGLTEQSPQTLHGLSPQTLTMAFSLVYEIGLSHNAIDTSVSISKKNSAVASQPRHAHQKIALSYFDEIWTEAPPGSRAASRNKAHEAVVDRIKSNYRGSAPTVKTVAIWTKGRGPRK